MAEQDSLSEPAAFDRLYRQQGSPIRKFLRLSVGNSAVADDLTQETFLHLWRRPASFNPERGGIKAYLLGIARKKAADWWRHHKSDTAIPAEQLPTTADCLAIRDALNRCAEPATGRHANSALVARSRRLFLRGTGGYSQDPSRDCPIPAPFCPSKVTNHLVEGDPMNCAEAELYVSPLYDGEQVPSGAAQHIAACRWIMSRQSPISRANRSRSRSKEGARSI